VNGKRTDGPPERTALYRVWGDADLLLYIGVSNDFGRRWREHAERQPWWGEMRRLTVDEWFDSRPEAEEAEEAAIKAECPKYNIVHNGIARGRVAHAALAEPDAGPCWIPVRIPDWEKPPVHPLDWGLSLGRPYGFGFTMAELTLSDPVRAEAMIAALPEESRTLARMNLESWRLNYKACRVVWETLQDLNALELTENRPAALAKIRSARASCRTFLEIPCPCCSNQPPAGMTCSECNAPGPAFARSRRRPALEATGSAA